MPIEERLVPAVAVTRGPKHHFFGYYDKLQLDPSGRYLLGLAVNFVERPPTAADAAVVGMVDLEGQYRWIEIGKTCAWCWQQGCMLQWVPGQALTVVYNDRKQSNFVAVIQNLRTGAGRVLPRPIYALSPDGRTAVSLNFSRLARCRPGYGYVGGADPQIGLPAPTGDGIWRMDIESGKVEQIVSLAQLVQHQRRAEFDGVHHWVNHLQFNADGSRLAFVHRWGDANNFSTRLYTVGINGAELYLLNYNPTSHYAWRDRKHLLAWAYRPERGWHFYLFRDLTQDAEIVAPGLLDCDGHCSFSPDRQWILTDTYPDERGERSLFLYQIRTNRRITIGRFYSPAALQGELRCDLHPRWIKNGQAVCVDSAHDGSRQMYVLDVGGIVSAGSSR